MRKLLEPEEVKIPRHRLRSEISDEEFTQRLQGLPESARVFLRFARERGLI